MKKKIKDYIGYIDGLLGSKKVDNIDEIISDHLIKIGFFEHERIVHLVVTALFAILSLILFC